MKNSQTFPFPILFLIIFIIACTPPKKAEYAGWFPFQPNEDFSESVIDASGWLDAPAGKHGFLQINGDDLQFEDGTPVKFWGVNISSGRPFSDQSTVDQWVNQLAKYGVNGVRFHKFTRHAFQESESTVLREEKYASFDYFNQALREKGIYYGWSHIYGHKVMPADSASLLNYREIASLEYPWSHLNGTTSSLINFAPDLQDLSIRLTEGMLEHHNPLTGLRYADDPALAFIELQNEDNIFWGAIGRSLEQAPTYRALLCEQFSTWLMEKYKNEEAWKAAWGKNTIPEGESLAKQNVFPNPNHGLFSSEYEAAFQEKRPIQRHILDKMTFLYEKQNEFYERFVAAIRATGYRGVIVGSCWQAGTGISHYYNLHADYQAGMIDRHNYWGGGTGHRLVPGKVKTTPMLSRPGSGLLSTGMQQVIDRPFSLSEWMSLIPNQWVAEAVPIIGIYGMGLQDWDASFHFGSDHPEFTETIHTPGVYNVNSPTQLTFYPAISRMIYRNDIQESEVISTRNVHVPSLTDGKLGFYETVEQGYDDKYITGDVPAEIMAAGKVAVAFTDTFKETVHPEIPNLWNQEEKWVKSVTGQLYWNYAEEGYFTANTPAFKAVVGFAADQNHDLDDV
ncbi:MAG: hypothetical protein KDD63_27565, partial [Bacteroidetes bacterium]|nr:hypothetical protein [Bacteroidota bacterium]